MTHFDDKEDLFLTVVRYYMEALDVGFFTALPETATSDTFWPALSPALSEVYRRAFVGSHDRSHDLPWAFGA